MTDFDELAAQVLFPKIKAAEIMMTKLGKQLDELKNPEKLIGRPYESWSDSDKTALSQMYGSGENPLTLLIAKKEYEKAKQMEAEVM